MDMQQLESFCAIVDQGNFTRGATLVHRSQSAVSRQMQGLEAELGTPLFDRSVKAGVVLTHAGERFLLFARTSLSQHHALREVLEDLRSKRRGRVRITCSETLAHLALPPYIRRYGQTHPQVDVRVLPINPGEALEKLREGQVDISIVMRSMVPQGMESCPWREGRYMIMAPKGHPLTRIAQPSLAEVAKHRIILPRPDSHISSRYKFDAKMAECGIIPDICLESDAVPLKAEYVRIGYGVCFLLAVKEARDFYSDEMEFIPMDHIFAPDNVVLCLRAREQLSPPAADFLEMLLNGLPKGGETDCRRA